jgi:hypothetical protein
MGVKLKAKTAKVAKAVATITAPGRDAGTVRFTLKQNALA